MGFLGPRLQVEGVSVLGGGAGEDVGEEEGLRASASLAGQSARDRLPAGRPLATGSSLPATASTQEAGLRGGAGLNFPPPAPSPPEGSPWQGRAVVSAVGPDGRVWILALPPPTRGPWVHHQTSVPQ